MRFAASHSRSARSAALAGALMAFAAGGGGAAAEGRLEAVYQVTILGLPIGSGTYVVDVGDDHYTITASGKVSGFLKAFSSGEGAAAVRGAVNGGKVAPSGFAMNIRTRNKTDDVRMALAGGAVKQLSVEPPIEPDPEITPINDAHKRGVTDPISAGIIPFGANGLGPEACDRRQSIFDGRIRFDLALSYKRMEKVKTEQGYEGPAIVCAVSFQPLAGHDPGRSAIKFLRESRAIELWFAPIAGTRFAGVYRIKVPTMIGMASLDATRFVSVAKPVRPAAASNAKTQ